MKIGHRSLSIDESSTQQVSEAARSVNVSPACLGYYRNGTGVKVQESINAHEEIDLEFQWEWDSMFSQRNTFVIN